MKVLGNILNFALVLIFLTASSGLGMYLHHCHMQEASFVSLSATESCCMDDRDMEQDVCCERGHETGNSYNDQEHDCCSTDFQYFKIENHFKVPQEEKTVSPVIMVNNHLSMVDLGDHAPAPSKGTGYQPFPHRPSSSPIFIRIAHLRL